MVRGAGEIVLIAFSQNSFAFGDSGVYGASCMVHLGYIVPGLKQEYSIET